MGKLKFKIDKKGNVSIEVEGMQGKACTDVTAAFEEALGVTVETEQKPEYFVQLDGVEQKNYQGDE